MASVAVSEASGGWKQTVSSLRSRLSTTVPALALFSAAAPATETEEAEGRMRERVRSFGSDMRRLRSKSCERVFQRCRRGWSAVTLATAATAEREEPGESFSNTATLRQSRRKRTRAARPSRSSYAVMARATADVTPSPYDTEALSLRAGDLVGVISQHPSGLWTGECEGRVGRFKFINVELVEAKVEAAPKSEDGGEDAVSSVAALLERLELGHLTSKLVLNGYDSVGSLDTLTRADLHYLGICDTEDQDKIITAAASWSCSHQDGDDHDLDSGYFEASSGSGNSEDLGSVASVSRRLGSGRRTRHHSSLPVSEVWSRSLLPDTDMTF